MILFFGDCSDEILAISTPKDLTTDDKKKLTWLFGGARQVEEVEINNLYVGPRAAMITPWSTNAVEITQNMGILGIRRIERFQHADQVVHFDPMLMQKYKKLNQSIFDINVKPQGIRAISDIDSYNQSEGLALSQEEIEYLQGISNRIGRYLTDSEVFGFSQVNSEHCRHKIFNGTFIIDGEEKTTSLFALIKKTSQLNPNSIVSAYKDNVAFVKGPTAIQFAPAEHDRPDTYQKKPFESVISLKAETHNFPTTVEPFNGAATGSGGEIRDRLAGGQGSIPLAGTAVYMTAYSRLANNRPWEYAMTARPWLYQSPIDILIKASNGASDFGNKFGQPLIAGSVLTFEHKESEKKIGYDKVIMLAGGIGYGKAEHAMKRTPQPGDAIVVMGGDNYRIGMGGAAVSSADTGEFSAGIELNAVQRSNPEMQKRVANTVRAVVESNENIIVSIHDHGAGGHLNCLSELVEDTGGRIELDSLPIGDPTLSAKEIIGNESQERMGLVVATKDLSKLEEIAARERAPFYKVGSITSDQRFSFSSTSTGEVPMDLALEDMFGSSPKTVLIDNSVAPDFREISYDQEKIFVYLEHVLKLEAVACKDWLTNKVDRCVGGRVAKQQCAGSLQLPLNNVAVMALDFDNTDGIATSIGHSPISGLIDAGAGARNSIAEALTNLIWAPLQDGIASVSLSANWMWPAKNPGEDARLYKAVQAVSDFAIALGINVPTGKDSLSMKQKYPDGEVIAPGTVIISTVGHCHNINKVVEPALHVVPSHLYYVDFSGCDRALGGSCLAQVLNTVGTQCPDVLDAKGFASKFNAVQSLIDEKHIIAGHDISAGGLITTLLEMCFPSNGVGATIDLSELGEADIVKSLFAENAGIVIQGTPIVEKILNEKGIAHHKIGKPNSSGILDISVGGKHFSFDVALWRDIWYETSYLLDQKQTNGQLAKQRFTNYKTQPLHYRFPAIHTGKIAEGHKDRPIKAAIIREQGSNSEREMAHALYLAGFDVRDVHMTDLVSGREDLSDIRFLGAVGGFSNSDVLGSAKGWAGSFLFNPKAKESLDKFFGRDDVLSLGICNGCQLFIELGLITPDHDVKPKMLRNDSGKHESSFTSVEIPENNSVMLSSMAGTRLGIWVSHGEGKFHLPLSQDAYEIVATYGYDSYPSNPNGSDYNAAMICSADGRHLVSMPHFERSMFPWNWAYYPADRKDQISPWHLPFVNAHRWLQKNS